MKNTHNFRFVIAFTTLSFFLLLHIAHEANIHGLRTPNEGINQRNLKIWADVADKICLGRNYKFGIGI